MAGNGCDNVATLNVTLKAIIVAVCDSHLEYAKSGGDFVSVERRQNANEKIIARDIRVGDFLAHHRPGEDPVYVVEEIGTDGKYMYALVRFSSGAAHWVGFGVDDETQLERKSE